MSFAIGQQVMCIKPRWHNSGRGLNRPKFMHIYTVRAYCPCADVPSILLVEIVNTKIVRFINTRLLGEPSWAEYHFRALEKLTEELELESQA